MHKSPLRVRVCIGNERRKGGREKRAEEGRKKERKKGKKEENVDR